MGEATSDVIHLRHDVYISIHASRGGSDHIVNPPHIHSVPFQSTLPVGEATEDAVDCDFIVTFQSTLPVGEATYFFAGIQDFFQFQSTLPVGEATSACLCVIPFRVDFNPRFPWGKRLSKKEEKMMRELFQSTLPVGEATSSSFLPHVWATIFQSTLPVGEATCPTFG